jgi:hypothetical protein
MIDKFLAYLQSAVYNAPGHHMNVDEAFAQAEAKSGVQLLVGDRDAIMLELGMIPHGNPADRHYFLPEDTPVKQMVNPRLMFDTKTGQDGK